MAELSRLPGRNADFWDWQLQAACRGKDPNIFFHPEGERGAARERRIAAAVVDADNLVIDPVQRQTDAIGPVQAGDQVEQCRFADPGLADDGDVFAGLQTQRDVPENATAIELAGKTCDFKHGLFRQTRCEWPAPDSAAIRAAAMQISDRPAGSAPEHKKP